MDFSTKITVGGQPVILVDQATLEGTKAWMKANSVFIPLGPAHSEAYLLMTGLAVRALSANSTHSIVWEQKVGTTSTTTTFLGWRLLLAERLLQGGLANDKSLYSARFVDGRYVANENSDCNVIANIRSYAQSADYLTGTSGFTWTSLLTSLWNSCGTLGAWPGLPAGLPIDSVPETTFLIGLNAYQALNAVLNQLDSAIAHNPVTGTYSLVQLGGAQTVANDTTRLEWDLEPIGSNIDIAANLKVYFNYHYKNYGQEQDTELVDNWAYNGAGNIVSTATGVTGAIGTKSVWDDMPWILGEDGSNTNSAAVATRAANRTTRYVTRATVPLLHKAYSGIISSYIPGGQLRAVLFRNWGSRLGGTQTEILGGPDLVESYDKAGFLNSSSYQTKDLAPPVYENYSALDLGRRSYPNYPRLPQIVQVHHSGAAIAGNNVAANADGVHPGRVKRVLNGVMTTYEDCWILFVDNFDVNSGMVDAIEDEYYYGRLTGVFTSGAVQNPLYLVKQGGEDEIFHFELEAPLTLGAGAAPRSAQAALLSLAGGVWTDSGTDIEVCDWYPPNGMWNGVAGYRGICVDRGDIVNARPAYDIIWMERIAQQIRGTTNEYIGATVAGRVSVVVDWYDHQGRDPGNTVNCFDPNNLFPATFSGAEVLAEYNNHAERYELTQAQQVVRFATALLNGALCADSSAVIDTFVGIPQSLDVGDPSTLPTTADNTGAHAGLDNGPVLIMRTTNTPNPSWTIVRSKQYLRKPIVLVEISAGNLQYKTVDIYTEVCDTAVTGTLSSPTTIAVTTSECS